MSVEAGVRLLNSNNDTDQRNGVGMIINAATQPENISSIINSGAIPKLINILTYANGDLLMRVCWAINNITVQEQGRNALANSGVCSKFNRALQTNDKDIVTKACWALTNLARLDGPQREIVSSGTMATLVDLLKIGSHEVKCAALQPLCNICINSEHQEVFKRNQGIQPTIDLLNSHDEKTKELAVTLISFVTTHHNSIREDIVRSGGLRPLCLIIADNGASRRMKELALNSLVNLSISENNEHTIIEQGVIAPVLTLLSHNDDKLQATAAMLLSNLFTNETARQRARTLNWLNPLLGCLRSSNIEIVTQAVRAVINLTFDEHCRYSLLKADADKILNGADSRFNNPRLSDLITSALRNISVPVSDDVVRSSGGTPSVQTQQSFNVGTSYNVGNANRVSTPPQTHTAPKPKSMDLDDILNDFGSKPPEQKPHTASISVGVSVNKPNNTGNRVSTPPQTEIKGDVTFTRGTGKFPTPPKDTPPPPPIGKNAPPPQTGGGFDDIDDLLSGISNPGPTVTVSANFDAPPNRDRAITTNVSTAYKNDFDDIDALISGINTGGTSSTSDIDDLLSDFDINANVNSTPNSGSRVSVNVDLKPTPKTVRNSTTADLSAIDDLLADLNF